MWTRIISNWTIWRFVRLGLGIFLLMEGIIMNAWFMVILGAYFAVLPVLNIGCGSCVTNEKCGVARDEINSEKTSLDFKEIK